MRALWAAVAAATLGVSGCAGSAVDPGSAAATAATTVTTRPVAPITTTTTTTTTTLPPTPQECVAALDLRVRVGQLIVPLAVQSELDAAGELAAAGIISGVALVRRLGPGLGDALAALHARAPAGLPLVVAVDEEGGRVQRLESLLGSLPSAQQVAAGGDADAARELARDRAAGMAELGITMNLAPVVDVAGVGYIGDRAYSGDPEVVARFATATIDGIAAAGVTPVAKHFPGHGSATDSHLGLPVTAPLAELSERDLLPFAAVIAQGSAAIMIGHLDVPGLTDGVPATLSPEAVAGLLRGELGFDGLVVSDALGMDAITDGFTTDAAAEAAVAAGVDLVLVPALSNAEPIVDRLEEAVVAGRLPADAVDAAVVRVLRTKRVDPCAVAVAA